MNAFLVELQNKPGALATITETLGARGVNITGISGASCGDSGRAAITTADDNTARAALKSSGVTFKELEVVETSLPHVPGSLGKVTRRLADAGVNIEAIFPTGMTGNEINLGFATGDPVKAREILATASVR
ncbi:MAG: ACT domain-containing protein [Chloroflexi bacterium]|nr:ACT domain-containing protein [Chloroflexota bacterium]